MNLTVKQHSIMKVIIEAHKKGEVVDLDQILERLDYRTTKESLQFSIRALIGHGLIKKGERENRRDRKRVTILPTKSGLALFISEGKTSFYSDVDELLEGMV